MPGGVPKILVPLLETRKWTERGGKHRTNLAKTSPKRATQGKGKEPPQRVRQSGEGGILSQKKKRGKEREKRGSPATPTCPRWREGGALLER